MIKLITEPYCENCSDFDPVVRTTSADIENNDPECPGIIHVVNTEVRCRYCKRCENIKRYLEKEPRYIKR